MSFRLEKVNSLLRQELSELLRLEIKDPRLSGLISITYVEIAPDLKTARVFVSSLGGAVERDAILQTLASASRFLRGELGRRVNMRYTPELEFRWDDSIERGAHILELLDQVKPPDGG